MTGPTQPEGPRGAAASSKSMRAPYFVVIGVLVVVLVGVLVWALWPGDGGSASGSASVSASSSSGESSVSAGPSSSASTGSVPPSVSAEPSPAFPSRKPREDTGVMVDKINAALIEFLPKKIENWNIKILDWGDGSTPKPIYASEKRRIHFQPLGYFPPGAVQDYEEPGQQLFKDGKCVPHTAFGEDGIDCEIQLNSLDGAMVALSSRHSDIDEMVRISKAILANQ